MPYHVYIVEPPSLLEDLLEDSGRVFHHHSAIIQRVFHDRWLELVGEAVGREQTRNPDARRADVEALARRRLENTRHALRAKREQLIQEERDQRAARDAAIRAYVASVAICLPPPAAA